ncbi:hypothetical protein DRO32_05540, partial [Candidatus Bathyarchaeota archaeon]
ARDEAYRLVRELALRAIREDRSFVEVVAEEEAIRSLIPEDELRGILRPEGYLGMADRLVEEVVSAARVHPVVARFITNHRAGNT